MFGQALLRECMQAEMPTSDYTVKMQLIQQQFSFFSSNFDNFPTQYIHAYKFALPNYIPRPSRLMASTIYAQPNLTLGQNRWIESITSPD